MIPSEEPLNELLLDATEVDKTRLANTLKGILGVDKETGSLVLKPGFNKLSAKQKVIAYLLGRKAAFLLGKNEAEPATFRTIQSDTGMPSGTVGPKTRELLADRIISQTDNKEYYVEQHQLLSAIEEIETGGAK